MKTDPRDKAIFVLIALIVASSYVSFIAGSHHTPKPEPEHACIPFTTDQVIDGDTITTQSGKTLRLARIDAPEKGMQGADKSTAFLRKITDANTCFVAKGEGYYGRTIVEIKTNVSDLMLTTNHAQQYK